MKSRFMIVGLLALLFCSGGALAWWAVQDSSGDRPATRVADVEPESADQPAAPASTDRSQAEIIRPGQPAPVDEMSENGTPAKNPAKSPTHNAAAGQGRARLALEELAKLAGDLHVDDGKAGEDLRLAALEGLLVQEELAALAGKFVFAVTISGTVLDAAGTATAGANVYVRDEADFGATAKAVFTRYLMAGGSPKAQSDASGNFSIAFSKRYTQEPSSVKFFVTASAGGTRNDAGAVEFSLRNGETKDGLRVELPPSGTLTGRVVDAQGMAVPGAMVRATATAQIARTINTAEGKPSILLSGGGNGGATTDANGQFRIAGLGAGQYSITATKRGYAEPIPAKATITVGVETAAPDLVLKEQVSLKLKLVGLDATAGRASCRVTFYNSEGKAVSEAVAAPNKDGELTFLNVPENAATFDLRSALFDRTAQYTLTRGGGPVIDYGSVTVIPKAAKPNDAGTEGK